MPLIIVKFNRLVSSQISNEVDYSVYSYDGMLLDHPLFSTKEHEIVIITPITNSISPEFEITRSYYVRGKDVFNSSDGFFIISAIHSQLNSLLISLCLIDYKMSYLIIPLYAVKYTSTKQ